MNKIRNALISLLTALATAVLILILFPNFKSELGYRDIPYYAYYIMNGGKNWGVFFFTIFNFLWRLFRFEKLSEIVIMIKIIRIYSSFMLSFSISLITNNFSKKKNISTFQKIIWNLVTISLNLYLFFDFFYRLRLNFGLSLFFQGFYLNNFLKKNKKENHTNLQNLISIFGHVLIIISSLIHEMVLIIVISYIFAKIFIVFKDKFNFNSKIMLKFCIFEIILLLVMVGIFLHFNTIQLDIASYSISFSIRREYYLGTIFIITLLVGLLSKTIYFFKNKKKNKTINIKSFFLIDLIVLSLLSFPIMITNLSIFLIEIFNVFFYISILLYDENKLDKIQNSEFLLILISIGISLFNRLMQFLNLNVNNISLISQFYRLEMILASILFFQFFLCDNLKIYKFFENTKFLIKYFQNKKINLNQMASIIIILSVFLNSCYILLSEPTPPYYNPIFMDEKSYYYQFHDFNDFSIKIGEKIAEIEEKNNQTFFIETNDDRISIRLSLLLMRWVNPEINNHWLNNTENLFNYLIRNYSYFLIYSYDSRCSNSFEIQNLLENNQTEILFQDSIGIIFFFKGF